MFFGEYYHTLDAKCRMVMPAKFREALGERFVITKGLDKCLYVYTISEFEALHEKLKLLPMMDESVRRFIRFFFGGAADSVPDAGGRVVLPQNLREYAGIVKDVVSMGVSNKIEIWSKENWTAYNENDALLGINKELSDKIARELLFN